MEYSVLVNSNVVQSGESGPSGNELDITISKSSFQIQVPLDLTTDTHFIITHSIAILAAFNRIDDLHQLDCRQDTGFNIRATELPSTMTPTLPQKIIQHYAYVDMLPWISLRDRILNLLAAINEPEFVQDMVNLRVWGSTP
jgi:hypothetical protein